MCRWTVPQKTNRALEEEEFASSILGLAVHSAQLASFVDLIVLTIFSPVCQSNKTKALLLLQQHCYASGPNGRPSGATCARQFGFGHQDLHQSDATAIQKKIHINREINHPEILMNVQSHVHTYIICIYIYKDISIDIDTDIDLQIYIYISIDIDTDK